MKIYVGSLIAITTGVEIDRKVPPRHPTNRLARLESFCTDIGNGDFATEKFPAEKFANRCKRITNQRNAAFDDCGFYSPTVKNGGPDPNASYDKKANNGVNWDGGLFHGDDRGQFLESNRKRRSDDCGDWDGDTSDITYFQWFDAYEGESLTVQADEPCAADYIHPDWLDDSYLEMLAEEEAADCVEECEDNGGDDCDATCASVGVRGSNSASRIRRINNKGAYGALKTVMSGLRKWGERYLAECPGQMTGRHMVRRNKFIVRAMTHFFTPERCTDAKCNDWGTRVQNGEKFTPKQMKRLWGRKNIEMKRPNIYN